MKRLFVVISSLLVLPAFAEVAPQILYDDGIGFIDDVFVVDEVAGDIVSEQTPDNQQASAQQDNTIPKQTIQSVRTSGRATSSRITATRANQTSVSPRSKSTGRTVSARNITNSTTTTPRTTTSRPAVARTSVAANANVITRPLTNTYDTAANSSTRASVLRGGSSLYNANRVSSRNSGLSFSASSGINTSVSATNTNDMDSLAELTDYCKAQYAMCMDNYCNVLDDNEGRCSCSANLENYAEIEEALQEATEALQDVAQQIQYIGLSAKDIETIFSETEAEEAMVHKTDSTQLKSDLDKIKRMIVDVKSGKANSSATSNGIIDLSSGLLDFSFSSTGFDLTSFMNITNTSNTSSISNQRGASLYKTASARCKANVLNSCSAQGVDVSVITNSYDLQIDKACLAYERNLKDANEQMTSTVRNAKSVLQKARLMVAQNKNLYDLRGCVEALDSCMQSDFVCGSDYENCLDSTGKYIVNGEVVPGSEPGVSGSATGNLYKDAWAYNGSNAWGDNGDLASYVNSTTTYSNNQYPSTSDKSMSKFLQFKIGYFDNTNKANNGMCISVLNQCQNYTYDNNGNYVPGNSAVKEYLMRTLTQIKAAQDNILADYAENCLIDAESCLTTNNYSRSKSVAINACRAILTTCKSVNNTGDTGSLQTWVEENIMKNDY